MTTASEWEHLGIGMRQSSHQSGTITRSEGDHLGIKMGAFSIGMGRSHHWNGTYYINLSVTIIASEWDHHSTVVGSLHHHSRAITASERHHHKQRNGSFTSLKLGPLTHWNGTTHRNGTYYDIGMGALHHRNWTH